MSTLEELSDEWGVDEEAIEAYCSNYLVSPDDVDKDHFFDSYCGEWDDLEQYAEDLVMDIIGADNWLVQNNYVAYHRLANDLKCEGYWIDGGYVFRPA